MARPERYFIGPGVKDGLRDVLTRVGAMPLGGGADETPTRLTTLTQPNGGRLQRGTFSGSWAIGGTKEVALIDNTATTVLVTNYCVDVVQHTAHTTALNVVFANVMGTVTAVEIQQDTATSNCTVVLGGSDLTKISGYDASTIQLLGHSSNINPANTNTPVCVTLAWYSITQCATVV